MIAWLKFKAANVAISALILLSATLVGFSLQLLVLARVLASKIADKAKLP